MIKIMKSNVNVRLRASYQSPHIEILQLDESDVITTSEVEIEEKGPGFELNGSNW